LYANLQLYWELLQQADTAPAAVQRMRQKQLHAAAAAAESHTPEPLLAALKPKHAHCHFLLRQLLTKCLFLFLSLQISYRTQRKRMAVLVSKMDHCLFDLLIRQRSGELHCDIPVVISNHPDLGHVADMFGVDFEHLGFRKDLDKAVAKQQQEAAIQRVRLGQGVGLPCR
jgi:hypothetical protein